MISPPTGTTGLIGVFCFLPERPEQMIGVVVMFNDHHWTLLRLLSNFYRNVVILITEPNHKLNVDNPWESSLVISFEMNLKHILLLYLWSLWPEINKNIPDISVLHRENCYIAIFIEAWYQNLDGSIFWN